MKTIRKITAVVLSLVLALGLFGACGDKSQGSNEPISVQTESDNLQEKEKQIKENIAGCWESDTGYLMLLESGDAYLIPLESETYEEAYYTVEGDTVTIHASAAEMVMEDVEVNDKTLTYKMSGNMVTWTATSVEEAAMVLEWIGLA